MMLYFKQVIDSLLQLGDLLAEQAGAYVLQDLMANEQAV
jgi:polyhydroxyalkanoate synthesis regulator phasin